MNGVLPTISVPNAQSAAREAKVDMFLLFTIKETIKGSTVDMIETGCFVTEPAEPNNIRCEPIERTRVFPKTYTHKQINFVTELVKHLEYEFPFIKDGSILHINADRNIEVDKGRTTWKIRTGTRYLLLHRANEYRWWCPITNFLNWNINRCRGNNFYGKAVVTSVSNQTSDAKVIEVIPGNEIHPNDRVMTK
ncbi:MAG: hypothetical protein HQL61_17305 [Magnetococcales bacterium]|nr:hypothetical protein [Nitrospirota bacterium]